MADVRYTQEDLEVLEAARRASVTLYNAMRLLRGRFTDDRWAEWPHPLLGEATRLHFALEGAKVLLVKALAEQERE